MKDWNACHRAVCWTVLLLTSAPCLLAQHAVNGTHRGIPQDWSDRQVVFSQDGILKHPELLNKELRIQHQVLQRWGGASEGVFRATGASDTSANPSHRDWNFSLAGGRLAPEMFPAKFSFDPGAPPSCTNDYVVFGLNVAGSVNQANLVALDNLYSGGATGGFCNAAGPSVLFAYNISTVTGGKIATSPVISYDATGAKIAFVESSNTATTSIFHVLTWTRGQGAVKSPATPVMTSLTYAAANNTRSSPWVDYNTDTAYVGADNGVVYKINGVFKSTPTPAGAPWPITLSAGMRLTPPVLDKNLGLLLVGSQNGTLYSINTTTGAVKSLVVGGKTNRGILAAPIVDVTNGTTFVVSSNDGTGAVLVQVDTATLTQLTKGRIGIGSQSGTSINLYQPAFDNNYYNNPGSGFVRLCGTGSGTDTTPWQYAFGFTGRVMNSTAAFSKQISTTANARCTGWTEFYNPNIGGGTDYFFFGLTTGCPGNAASGCVLERLSDTSLAEFDLTGGPTGIVIDNYSTDSEASSLYLTDQGTPDIAYKLTQNGLQ